MKNTIIATNEPFNSNWIQPALKDLVRYVERWIGNSHKDIAKTAEEIANGAIAYALKPGLTGKGPFPSSKEHLFRTARMFAKYAFLDEVKQAKYIAVRFDDHKEDEDGDEMEITPAEAMIAEEKHRAYTQYKEMKAMGRSALRRLDDFLRKHGVSFRDIEVYKEWELYNVPTDSVCKRHGIKTSNLHKIVCVVNGILRRCGRDLLKDE